jgi:hypothetical protein
MTKHSGPDDDQSRNIVSRAFWARAAAAFISAAALVSCSGGEGLSTAELQTAAKKRVARQLGLSDNAVLFTNTFVSQPDSGELEDELVLCGTVEGKRADGTQIAPRRFIAATDPARWVRFDAVDQMTKGPINMAADWATACAGGEEVK